MDNKKMDNDLLIIYIVWVIFLLLGIRFIYKYKLWNRKYYLILLAIFTTYIIVLYQIQIVWTCFPMTIDTFQNQNKYFKLYNRSDIPSDLLFQQGDVQTGYGNWDVPLKWPGTDKNGNPLTPNFYADDNNTDGRDSGNVCKRENILQLTDLVSVSTQQLQDATNAYKNLLTVQSEIRKGDLVDLASIQKLLNEVSGINQQIVKQPKSTTTK